MKFAASSRRQWAIIGGVFALFVLVLALGYFAFLRGGYVTLADGVRPGEAAAIVAELDKRGTAYELRDGGTTILVPEDEADAIRLSLVRSDAAVAGQIGFELFNKSDMGLTNFAQKINYQRALQGELVRTITMMDGVEAARVHLALPERALFRDDRTEPSAAVTVTMRAGLTPDPARVSGIQRLVSAAVPDLPAERVVVLDADGRVLTQTGGMAAIGPGGNDDRPADAEALGAVEQYYRAIARGAIERAYPGLRYHVQVGALAHGDMPIDPAHWAPGETGSGRDFRLRVTITTVRAIDPATRAGLAAAVSPSLGLVEGNGDLLSFETGSIATATATAPVPPPVPAVPRVTLPDPTRDVMADGSPWPTAWWLLALVPLAVVVILRRRSARDVPLPDKDRAAFAQALQRQLARSGGGDASGNG